ncbi:MAG TPA: mitochondrial fission ELM1 family protein [Rhizomicrobium sp.]|nr:mitochondrial fission ELM1 family protein [Rhizomicrobium sp.]
MRSILSEHDFSIWVVTDGGAGFEVQALGIAEALGVTPEIKRVKQGAPWRWLAPWGPAMELGDIRPPWPDLVLAAGRQSIPYARYIRRASQGKTFVAVLQDPRVPPHWFDFVWVPAHDKLRGSNVFSTIVSPHRLTPERLLLEAHRIEPSIDHLPRPRIAVLLGGANGVFQFDEKAAARIGHDLAEVAKRYGAGLMVTPSRRTGDRQAQIIRERINNAPAVMWSGEGENPYFGYLGAADVILVTCDSVNMVGEAAGTGKPVYVIGLEGGSAKWDRFLGAIYAHGAARPFKGEIDSWTYVPLNATEEIAAAIVDALGARWNLS